MTGAATATNFRAALTTAVTKLANTSLVAASAHTIKGSARGIGAWRIARDAETVEMAAACAGGAELSAAVARLATSVAETQVAIAHRLCAF